MQAKKEKEREEKEKKKEKERREKEKEKEREREKEKEKEKGKERLKKDEVDGSNMDDVDDQGHREEKKREKDKEKKHRKRHHSATDDASSDKDEKEDTKKSRRHSGDRKKSRKVRMLSMLYTSDVCFGRYTQQQLYLFHWFSLLFIGSMDIHLNLTVRTGIKNTKEIIGMDLVEMAAPRSLKMVRLVKMGKSNRYLCRNFVDLFRHQYMMELCSSLAWLFYIR